MFLSELKEKVCAVVLNSYGLLMIELTRATYSHHNVWLCCFKIRSLYLCHGIIVK